MDKRRRPSGGGKNFAVWNAIAEAVKSVDKNHLMTFHPMGGSSSSEWFHKKDWLNFNMFQSGHGKRDFSNYRMIMRDYKLQPANPVSTASQDMKTIP